MQRLLPSRQHFGDQVADGETVMQTRKQKPTPPSVAQVLTWLKELGQVVESSRPHEAFNIQPIQLSIVGMYWRAVRLYNGAVSLLGEALPEEAAILGRSLSKRVCTCKSSPLTRCGATHSSLDG